MLALLYVVFTLSGAAGLVYETIWSRYLGLFVGHSAYAQVIVLVIFLGGMSIGAMAAGRRSERLREPLLWYAVVELIVGIIGIGFHDAFVLATRLAYDTIFPSLPSPMVVIMKWLIAALLILPQSVLLGATFPLMSAGALRRARMAGSMIAETPGRVLALLYFTNSIGAAAGALIAGFVLIAAVGLPGTLLVAAGANVLVALVAYGIARWTTELDEDTAERQRPLSHASAIVPGDLEQEHRGTLPYPRLDTDEMRAATAPELRDLWRLLLLVSFGTAVASFIYEIAWIRALALVLGSATHAFELMLSAFILGLAAGAFWVRTRADGFPDSLRALGVTQVAMGSLAVATLPLYVRAFGWMSTMIQAFAATPQGYDAFTVGRYVLCLAIMLPATFCAGITLPLITRTLLARGAGEGAVGAVYGVNTLGSIVGAALAGLVLLPLLGLKFLLITGAAVDIALGYLLLTRAGRVDVEARQRAMVVASVVAVAALFVAVETSLEPWLLTSGVFRGGYVGTKAQHRMLFYADGRTATVSGRENAGSLSRTIATNGKPDASLDATWLRPADGVRRAVVGDQPTQLLLPIVTLAHAPHARTAAVIGQGSGMTSHILLGDPSLERLVTIDIEPQMIRGSRIFYPANRRVFDDKRSQFAIDDAKSYFAASRTRYDLILSEPSNPWVSGVSGLFTTEFYSRVRQYLAPHGVFGQWLHLYEIDDGLVLSVIAALHEAFPSYAVYQVAESDVLIVASADSSLPAPDWSVAQRAGIAEDLARVLPIGPRQLDALLLLDRQTLAPLVAMAGRGNSDFYPTLDLATERTRYLHMRAAGFEHLGVDRFDVAAALRGAPRGFDTTQVPAIPEIARITQLALSSAMHAPARSPYERVSLPGAQPSLVGDQARSRYTVAAFEQNLASASAPADWREWSRQLCDAERMLHAGTAGVADEEFYGRVFRYLSATHAPPPAIAAAHFLHGIAAWNWVEANQASTPLLDEAVAGRSWIPGEVLRDGAVVAQLRLGMGPAAMATFKRTVSVDTRSNTDIRVRLIGAHALAAAGGLGNHAP